MLFFELLQIAIRNRERFSQAPTEEEWQELFAQARRQAMVGIAFRGVEQLPEEQRPHRFLLMQWYMATERIKTMNADLDRKALTIANRFLADGFPGVVLKGQGIAQLYRVEQIENSKLKIENCHPECDATHYTLHTTQERDLSSYRTPGDIDIWLMRGRDKVLEYVRRHVPNCKPVYHHVDFPVVEGVDIEVHFTPTWMNSPVTNRRLQKFFHSFNFHLSSSNYPELPVPSLSFNRVYILVHIYRHLFAEGIGLRQLLDYYFVLCQGFTEEERQDTMRTLRALKMQRFAAAVMWVLQQVFGMADRYQLTAPNEREGRFLLNEIMLAGNFGQHDERLQHSKGESRLHWGLRKVKRNFRFVRSYPSEVLWSPIFKLWQFFWLKNH